MTATKPGKQAGRSEPGADVIVIGCGIVGLSTALALADRGLRVCAIGEARPGEASPAAAGILGPTLEDPHGNPMSAKVQAFNVAARDRYVAYVAELADRSGVPVPLNRLGILELALDETRAELLRGNRNGRWLDSRALAALEPSVAHAVGAMLYENDGSVDNVAMLRALRDAVECTSTIARIEAAVIGIEINAGGVICHAAGPREAYEAPRAVLAAGAWVGGLEGLPRQLPIEPLRGQMLAVGATDRPRPRHVVYGADAYLVPRGERVLVGATQERVGFDSSTTASALTELRAGAATLWPGIEGAPMTSSWAGLRPVTPDLLPILGPDPEYPSLVYACGHSRSGILMAPLTAECVADLIVGKDPPADLSPFRVERFDEVASKTVESRTGT